MMPTVTSSSGEGVLYMKNVLRFPLYRIQSRHFKGWKPFTRFSVSQSLSLSLALYIYIFYRFALVYVFSILRFGSLLFFYFFSYFFPYCLSGFYFTLFLRSRSNIYNAQIHYKLRYTKMRWISFAELVWGFEKEPNIFYSFELVWRAHSLPPIQFVHLFRRCRNRKDVCVCLLQNGFARKSVTKCFYIHRHA